VMSCEAVLRLMVAALVLAVAAPILILMGG
jgi:hypothetical protein